MPTRQTSATNLSGLPEVDWSSLSAQTRTVLSQVGYRLIAGWSYTEIAAELERTRPELEHLPLPPEVKTAWVAQQWRAASAEVRASAASD